MRRYRGSLSANKISKELANYTKILAIATIILAIATILLVFVNQNLTDITKEYYKYNSPDVSLIEGYIAKLYVLRDNNSGSTYFTILGMSSVYNSALSRDVALLKQKNLGNSFNLSKSNKIGRNDTISIEGSSFPIPISPGESPKNVPLLITYKKERIINTNATVELEIDEKISIIEVLHPNKTILTNLTSLKPMNIIYTMGKDTAIVKMNDGGIYNIDVRYTEDKETYEKWKITFLRPYGISALII